VQALEGGAAREAVAAGRVRAQASASADASADANASAERGGAAGAAAEQRDPAGAGARAAPSEVADVQETAAEYLARRGETPVDGPGEMDAGAVGAIAVCVVCHGADGEGHASLSAPRIGGVAEWYLARQLKYFKDGLRAATIDDVHGTQMRAVALTLEDQAAIEDLAAYLATLSPPPAPALTSGDAEHGEALYAVCAACHGEDARGRPELNTPSMIGQDGEYLVRQLENFKSGVRGMHPSDLFGRQMVPIVQSTLMSREDMVDVITYVATLGEGGGN
jgi:cytochrome c oxidase subunit 2